MSGFWHLTDHGSRIALLNRFNTFLVFRMEAGLEHDKKSPTLAVLFRICDALEVRLSDVIARVEKSRAAKRSK